jgi:hypothetical protein
MAGTITLGGQTLASHDTASNTSSIVVDQLTSPIMNAAQLKTNGIEFNNSGLVLTKFETGTWNISLEFLYQGYIGNSSDYGTPVTIGTGLYTRIGNLVYITTGWIGGDKIPQDAIAVKLYSGLPFTAAEYSELTCGRVRGGSMRYNTSISTTDMDAYRAYVNKDQNEIGFIVERIGVDHTGFIYIPTKSGSNLPSVSGFYMTDEE